MKKGEYVVKVLAGYGTKTAVVKRIAKVTKGVIYLVDYSIKYDASTLQEINPAIPGFSSELIPFDGGEVERLNLKGDL